MESFKVIPLVSQVEFPGLLAQVGELAGQIFEVGLDLSMPLLIIIFMLDFSLGKVVYLKNRHSLNFNISANNLLDSRLITGGFQQARIPYDDNAVTGNVYKFPSKYYYALGANYFATISYKF